MSELQVVEAFIDERPQYIEAIRQSHADNDDDRNRWRGAAEARRQLAERLGWTVPHELGEKTKLKGVEQ